MARVRFSEARERDKVRGMQWKYNAYWSAVCRIFVACAPGEKVNKRRQTNLLRVRV